MSELFTEVESLIKKAGAPNVLPLNALQLTQAALNAANALAVIDDIGRRDARERNNE